METDRFLILFQVKLEKLAEARLSKRLSRRSRISVAVDKAMTPIKGGLKFCHHICKYFKTNRYEYIECIKVST